MAQPPIYRIRLDIVASSAGYLTWIHEQAVGEEDTGRQIACLFDTDAVDLEAVFAELADRVTRLGWNQLSLSLDL